MTLRVRIQKGFRITIPKQARELLGWKVGDALEMKVTKTGLALKRVIHSKK